ncbi:CHAT domain-containing protein [Aspergillus terricola var. indicus]
MTDMTGAAINNKFMMDAIITDDRSRAAYLNDLYGHLYSLHERTGNLEDPHAGIAAELATLEDHHDRAIYLNDLSIDLAGQHERTGNLKDLDAAITNAILAVAATSNKHPLHAMCLNNLSIYLSSRYEQTGDLHDLDATITNSSLEVSVTPDGHPDHANHLYNLSVYLSRRYKRTRNLQDLDAAIIHTSQALSTMPDCHPDYVDCLKNLTIYFSSRYERAGKLQDLDAAIANASLTVAATADDHPGRVVHINMLSSHLSRRYKRTGNLKDLEAAITNANLAVTAALDDQRYRALCLNNLSIHLYSLYERTRNLQDLEAAINNAQLAVAATPDNNPVYADRLDNLSVHLASRYERVGNMQDLEAAITNSNLAVSATPDEHPDQAVHLNNLSIHLATRYERTGNFQDLEAAILNANRAVAATPESDPNRAGRLNILSSYFARRYERTRSLQDLDAAMAKASLAIATTPNEHPDRASYLNNISIHLANRYKQTGYLQDLEAAITEAKLAVAATPENDQLDHATCLYNLSSHLSSLYERTGNLQELEAAITNANMAVAFTPDDHPDRALYLNNLSMRLCQRNVRTGNMQDLEMALQHFLASANLPNAVPLCRIRSARGAIRMLQRLQQDWWKEAAVLAEKAVQLLPLVCTRYLNREDQQHAVSQTTGLAADACSLFLQLGQPEKALQMLEFGRGLILGYLVDSRNDVDRLQRDHPSLAKEYDQLRFVLSQALDSVHADSRDQLLQQKSNVPRKLEECISTIRQQEGYEQFLLVPPVKDLMDQAAEGPIVIVNITDFGSHAIIVQNQHICSLHLPEMLQTSRFALDDQIRRFCTVGLHDGSLRDIESELESFYDTHYDASSLGWLWSHCVKPVIRKLNLEAPVSSTLPRIWWIGTGAASTLPFHAAGDHGRSTENTMSHAISSYIPTIKALAYSRSQLAKLPPKNSSTSIYIAAMPTTPNERPLPGVEPEVNAIQQACRNNYTVTLQDYPTPEAVLSAMEHTDIIHFACHGFSNPINPSDSHLLLQRSGSSTPTVGMLTVQQISDRVFRSARIAYLSACSTAQVSASEFTDEAIHLASAFQVAGFAHVIGSLWSVGDAICVQVARSFYSYLVKHQTAALSNRLIAEALHTAVLDVRSQGDGDPSAWACFIHHGA